MNSRKRKNELCRIRVKKHRAIAKMFRDSEVFPLSDDTHIESCVENSEETLAGSSSMSENNEESIYNFTVHKNTGCEQSADTESNCEEIIDSEPVDNIESSTEGEEMDELQEGSEIEDLEEDPEIQQIRKWAVKHQICQSYLDELLQILRRRLLPTLPKSSKTFLKTVDAKYNILEMEDANGDMGEFVYLGIETELKNIVNPHLHRENNLIELQVNIDGAPLTKSGSQQIIPILCKIHYDPDIYEVFTVAIYHGQAKPKYPGIFLQDFIDEINKLQTDGILIADTHFEVRLKCLICDTPARAWLKNTLGHGGLYGCERCTVKGERCNNRTVYPSVDSEERTDESFRNRSQCEHHHPGPSPLTAIRPALNMVSLFVLDFMHLCCIGIMKKLLEYWLMGNLNLRMDRRSRNELSRRVTCLKFQTPSEFQRKPRSTDSVAKWKATEFRFFLLYYGPVVLKGLLRDDLYNHFLLFFTACRILCSPALCLQYRRHAKVYLRSFFVALKDFYGPDSQILNCHHLIHLADDVEYMGCSLNYITAFPFESKIGKIKRGLRTPHRPLPQLCRRSHENKINRNNMTIIPPCLEIFEGDESDIKKISFKNYNLSKMSPDNIVILEDETIVMITKIFGNLANLQFDGQIWHKKKAIFEYPTNSAAYFKMWELQKQVTRETITYSINNVMSKLVKLSLSSSPKTSEKSFVIQFIH